jgi:hypothetical protein
MVRGLAASALAASTLSVAASCSAAPARIALPRLEDGAAPPGEAVALTARLVRSGACLAAIDAGGGTVLILWPGSARARIAGNVTIVWPFGRSSPPIRMGEEIEMAGTIVTADNISGLARIPDDPGCRRERYLLLREARSAPLDNLSSGSSGRTIVAKP